MPDESITQERLKELLHYDPASGLFTWKVHRNNRVTVGSVCGKNSNTYIRISINRQFYMAHRLAFLYMEGAFPPWHVDHINHNETDNRWCNLRKVSPSENARNRRKCSRNTSGVTGVHWKQGKWCVRIFTGGRHIHIGWSNNLQKAAEMRRHAEEKYGYHPNHE